ncbi:hypothetical protein ACFXOD_36175 [Streptomyces sp. NPDC059161]|uniref:hypothetical protein n=1 Tax=Streptomyces sp. NPDC059161 TaxID=3346749 RepID=UPI0036ADE44C
MPTALIGSQNSVKTGYKSSQGTDQYGLLRTFDQSLGLAPLTNNEALSWVEPGVAGGPRPAQRSVLAETAGSN